ncbi:MAG: undecaprenyldiphospho-muramoylpentapeptide beta-N-acetylglucosaminyltransferase [Bacteroidaceae bacterium]
MDNELRIIISGGGTGGHIFPAVSIANAIKEKCPEAKILFVGAEGRMEMQRVPAAGYEIEGLPVSGFNRKNLLKNISILIKLWKSQRKAKQIIQKFKPQVAVGVGGYASGPTLNMAGKLGIPTLLQEQNGYAGVTNKLLAKRANKICVAYEQMERFFPADKIIMTGNPVRQTLVQTNLTRKEGLEFFNLDPKKKTILIIGGSLGARTINESILAGLESVCTNNEDSKIGEQVQLIWQTGKYYYKEMNERVKQISTKELPLYMNDFISSMEHAYAAADLIISRAGAGSISEFCLLGKAVILVPSPNVAEDHQTKNAMALVKKGAAICITDKEAPIKLIPEALSLIHDTAQILKLEENILTLAKPNAAATIANEVIQLANEYRSAH